MGRMRTVMMGVMVLLVAVALGSPDSSSWGQAGPVAKVAVQQSSATRAPLCRHGFVPITRRRGFSCVRLRLPVVRSQAQLLRGLMSSEPTLPRARVHGRRPVQALNRADQRLIRMLVDLFARLTPQPFAARSASAQSLARAATAGASYDSGWTNVPGEPGAHQRDSGSVTYPPDGQSGISKEVTLQIRSGTYEDEVSWTMNVRLGSCPDANGKVTGSVSMTYTHLEWWSGVSGYQYRDKTAYSLKAAVTAPVSDAARIQPYDLKGTIEQRTEIARKFVADYKNIAPSKVVRMGFLDRRIPLQQTGNRDWTGGPQDSPFFFLDTSLMLREIYKDLGPRLESIETSWRERKQCVQVIPAPSTLKLAPGKSQQVIVTARRAGGGDVPATIDAVASTGTITPQNATTKLGAPAKFTFTMSSSRAGTIVFTATSRHGIGQTSVPVAPLMDKMVARLTVDWKTVTYPSVGQGHDELQVTFARNPDYDPAQPDSHMWIPESGSWTADDSGVDEASTCQAPYDLQHPSFSGHGSGTQFEAGGGLDYVEGTKLSIWVIGAEPIYEHYVCPGNFTYTVPTGAGAGFVMELPDADFNQVTLSGSFTIHGADGGSATYTWDITSG